MLTTSANLVSQPVVQPKKGFPPFLMRAMELVRNLATRDGVIRIKIDTTSSKAVCFHCHWLIQSSKQRDIPRKVFVESELTVDGGCTAVYMTKPFDPEPVVFEYALNDLDLLAKDIQVFLCNGKTPE
jgi:hypothetical protein